MSTAKRLASNFSVLMSFFRNRHLFGDITCPSRTIFLFLRREYMSQDLLMQFQNNPRLFQLADRLSFAQPQKIYLKNLKGSSSQFTVGATFLHPSCSQLNNLIILNDAEEAAYFHNTLENLTEALDIFYFPSSF